MLRTVKEEKLQRVFGNQYNMKVLFCVVPVASDSFKGPHTSPQVCVRVWCVPA